MSDLIECQNVVERSLGEGRPLAEIEDYIEDCALDQMEKAGLWMLAWAHQDQATQLRLARETLALVRSLQTTTALRETTDIRELEPDLVEAHMRCGRGPRPPVP